MTRYLTFAVLFVGILGAAWELGRRGAEAYERMLVQRVMNGFDVLGFAWAEIRADGLRLELYGHAPDEFTRDLAYESAVATAPTATVVNFATATLAPPERRDPVRVELLRDKLGVTLTGQTANRGMRERLNAALSQAGPELTIFDLTGIQAEQPPRGWGPEIDVASLAAARLPNAYVVMQPGHVAVDGQALDDADKEALERQLRELAGDRVSLELNLRIPDQVIAPFAFLAHKEIGGALRLERCAARSRVDRETFLERLGAHELDSEDSECRIGLGAPSADWGAAVIAGIDALQALPAGRIDVEYQAAQLTAFPPTSPDEFEVARDRFLAALPEDFDGAASLRSVDVASRTEIEKEQHWLELERSADSVALSGQVPDESARQAIETYAAALFGTAVVQSTLEPTGRAAPDGWQVAALRVLESLSVVAEGEARLAGYTISFSARVESPEHISGVHRELTQSFEGYAVRSLVEVDLPGAVAATPLPITRCTHLLSELNQTRPIDFDPGSAVIAESSNQVLNAMAGVLERCTDEQIEVGGHTDSQGREEMNLRLSQERAEAIVAALADRGISELRLVPQGYGETMPIADNDTEEGRARNRRIEFRRAAMPDTTEPLP